MQQNNQSLARKLDRAFANISGSKADIVTIDQSVDEVINIKAKVKAHKELQDRVK
jgi:hypothetical protein